MERTKKAHGNVNSLRHELEIYVIAWNKNLREVVGKMDFITLLRNGHPTYRPDFAYRLKDLGLITTDQAREFIKIVRR